MLFTTMTFSLFLDAAEVAIPSRLAVSGRVTPSFSTSLNAPFPGLGNRTPPTTGMQFLYIDFLISANFANNLTCFVLIVNSVPL